MLGVEPHAAARPRDGRHGLQVALAPRDLVPGLDGAGGARLRGGRIFLLVGGRSGNTSSLREVQRPLHPVPPVLPRVAVVGVRGAPDLRERRRLQGREPLLRLRELAHLPFRSGAGLQQLLVAHHDVLNQLRRPHAGLQLRGREDDEGGHQEGTPLPVHRAHGVRVVGAGPLHLEPRMEAEHQLVEPGVILLREPLAAELLQVRVELQQGGVVVGGLLREVARGVKLVRVAAHKQGEGVLGLPGQHLGADLDGAVAVALRQHERRHNAVDEVAQLFTLGDAALEATVGVVGVPELRVDHAGEEEGGRRERDHTNGNLVLVKSLLEVPEHGVAEDPAHDQVVHERLVVEVQPADLVRGPEEVGGLGQLALLEVLVALPHRGGHRLVVVAVAAGQEVDQGALRSLQRRGASNRLDLLVVQGQRGHSAPG
mmetsp:Transcript_40738/g.107644  ORF Transcript_40738/g.107644 Transcript_40738/m.107644 type:complete len:427 (+) Transcript_40738:282-1562(+)